MRKLFRLSRKHLTNGKRPAFEPNRSPETLKNRDLSFLSGVACALELYDLAEKIHAVLASRIGDDSGGRSMSFVGGGGRSVSSKPAFYSTLFGRNGFQVCNGGVPA